MTAGELGADYVLFGEPDAQGKRPSAHAIAERLAWWAELFEPPCVGYAASCDEATAFVAAGADFVLVDDLIWADGRDAKVAAGELGQAMQEAYARASRAAKAAQG
jgi:thiamine-phosphate pyrophosphorylase